MINKIYSMQIKLDEAMRVAHNIDTDAIKEKKVIAVIVEISEFANEVASFKYWKKNKNINHEKVTEEYVDVIHFVTSLYIYINKRPSVTVESCSKGDVNVLFAELFKSATKLLDVINFDNLEVVTGLLYSIGLSLDFDWDEIERSYIRKNEINYTRIKNNY
ncbi:MAG: dUTP diphosphatase [Mycoplasmataceae bacterium]|nr:dUTP diphosphatase [Mycoplasmataceae bacterium]